MKKPKELIFNIDAYEDMIDALIEIMEDEYMFKIMGSVKRTKVIKALKKAGVKL